MLHSGSKELIDVSSSADYSTNSQNEEDKDDNGIWQQSSREFRRELFKYRLKYLFSPSNFCKCFCQRILSGKQVYIILLMLCLEKIAYTTIGDYVIAPFLETAGAEKYIDLIKNMVFCVSNLLFPIAGWIGDAWVGQYNMLHCCLWLEWLGFMALALLYSISEYVVSKTILYSFLPLCFAVISFGSLGFQANAIPFGANTINYKSSQELSSYFYFYYWVRNFGLAFYLIGKWCFGETLVVQAEFHVMLAVCCLSLILVLNGCFRKTWFLQDSRERVNPYKKVFQVLRLAAVIQRPVYRSAFSYDGASPPSRLNLTKQVHGGKFSNEEVEDVKTFLRLVLMLLCSSGSLAVFAGIVQVIPFQVQNMNNTTSEYDSISHCGVSDNFIHIISNTVLLLVSIPVINNIMYPFIREYAPGMMKKIGLGSVLGMLSIVSLLVISAVGSSKNHCSSNSTECMFSADFESATAAAHNPLSQNFLFVPYVLMGFAEIFLIITGLEFLYAQSPHTMRSTMIGLFFFVLWGVGSGVSEVFIVIFSVTRTRTTCLGCDFWYYFIYLCISVGSFVCFVVFARWYKNRTRGEEESNRYYRPVR